MYHVLTISKGNQYDRDGYSIIDSQSDLHAFGEIGPRMGGTIGITRDGTFALHPSYVAECRLIDDTIRLVIADGVERTITLGQPPAAEQPRAEWRSTRGLTLNQEMEREDTIY